MENKTSLISVIIPLYNKEKSIRATIESVLDQSYKSFELIVVDDGSTDTSVDIVKSFDDSRLFLYQKENGGVSSARNYGVKHANGDWIVFLDADDLLLDNALDVLLDLAISKRQKIACANFYINENRAENLFIKTKKEGIVQDGFKAWSVMRCFPRTGCTIISRDIAKKHPHNEQLTRYEDAEVIFNLFRDYTLATSATPTLIFKKEYNQLSKNLSNPANDFVAHLDFKRKKFWEKVALGGILYSGLKSYKSRTIQFLIVYKHYICYAYLSKLISFAANRLQS